MLRVQSRIDSSFTMAVLNYANLVRTIEQLYDKATSAVQMNGKHRRMVQNNTRSKARMSSVTHPLQHFSRTDHV